MERLENKQVLGVIDATIDCESLAPLTINRPLASLPFSGRYRLIDFMLSNMVHAGIDSVGIFAHHIHDSLKGHIGSGKVWDLDRKNGGLFFYTLSEQDKNNSQILLQRSLQFFVRAPYQYVIIAPCNVVGRVPILDILRNHKEKMAVVTQVAYDGESLPIYFMERQHLVSLIEHMDVTKKQSLLGFVADLVQGVEKNIFVVPDTLLTINSLVCYYEQSMQLLSLEKWEEIFLSSYPIFTKTKDEPPTKYAPTAVVKKSVVANGCLIDGTVRNSLIARGVTVGTGAIVRNSIIMPGVTIGADCILDGVIVDKDVTIEPGAAVKRKDESEPRVIPKGVTIHKEWS